jgi:hypothetical protein
MRLLLALAALMLGFAPVAASAQPRRAAPAVVNARMGPNITWSQQRRPRPVTYRFGDVLLDVRPFSEEGLYAPRVTIRQGRNRAVMTGAMASPSYEHKFGVGVFDRRGIRFALLQSFTGGAHCCNQMQAAIIGPRGIRVVEIGTFDGGPEDAFPRDLDGDGVVDFVQRDNSFLYTFASYAGSFAPPQILNIVGNRIVDVSTRPGFRRLFRDAMIEARPICLRPEVDRNGACAGFVAAAARAGEFDAAWAAMLRAYDRDSGWELPNGCRIPLRVQAGCPAASVITYANFPDALRAFLVQQGYLAR